MIHPDGAAVRPHRTLADRGQDGCSEPMRESFFWGIVAGSSLVLGGLLALHFPIGKRMLGLIMAFGSGVLISAVAFELVQEAFETTNGDGGVALGLFAGSLVFFLGDSLIDRLGGSARKSSTGGQAAGSALAIVLGIVLDGIPESLVLGLTVLEAGTVSAAFLVAVFLSNLPESIAATTGLSRAGWKRSHIIRLWVLVMFVSGLAALAGYALLDSASPRTIAFVLAFAGGAILTMLADTMMPEAFENGGKLVGVVTTFGFALAFLISALD
jgi:zinc transporter, ZIP family